MVLWTLFAVILILCSTTCVKTDNDIRRISASSLNRMQNGYQRFDCNTLSCRYSKLLSTLKDNFNMEDEATSFDNVKAKNNYGAEQTGVVLAGSDSLEEDTNDDTIQLKDGDKSGHFLKTYDDFNFLNKDEAKRSPSQLAGCDCKIKNDLLDLGHLHYPRYLLNAVCQKDDETYEYPPKCWRGAQCKPLEYKVRVLTYRSHNDHLQKDPAMSLLPDVLRSFWKFKTVTVAAGCFCS